MEGTGFACVAVLAVIAAVGAWAFSMSLDKSRITEYVQQRGGRIVSISWAPFGRGWFGEKEERLYEVVYYDKDGKQHFATCKTAFWTGVFWTEDRTTHPKSTWYDSLPPKNERRKPLIRNIPKEVSQDEADELRQLREENARLREQLSGEQKAKASARCNRCPACGAALTGEPERCPDCQIALR
jgi:hypothetical protein